MTGVFYQITKLHYRKSHTIISSKGKWIIQKDTKERPNIDDYKIAWKCFLHIIDILQPTDCIFVGVESVTLFEEIMDKYGVQYTGIDVLKTQ